MSCPICHYSKTILINTHKHKWVLCENCKSASSYEKDNYLLKNISAIYRSFRRKIRVWIYKNHISTENKSNIFSYMASENHIKFHEKTQEFERFYNNVIIEAGIELKNKLLLDVSGGNGTITKKFLDFGVKDIFLTEYDEASVLFAKNNYNLKVEKFDFNKDDISLLFRDIKFDIIFLRAAIMFCHDINKFLEQLKKILNPNALIVVSASVHPTYRTIFEWQSNPYIVQRLYDHHTLLSTFEESGFVCTFAKERSIDECKFIDQYRKESKKNIKIYNRLGLAIYNIFTFLVYEIKAKKKIKNKDAYERASNYVFKHHFNNL